MERDPVDELIEQWSAERPDLDATPMGVVRRISIIAKRLELEIEAALAPMGMTLWKFDVLASLRRASPDYTLSPTQLTQASLLSSGAMTNRIDRLVEAELVTRKPDPNDRRGVLIGLTPKGRELTDLAVATRLRSAENVLSSLSDGDRRQLAELLRKLLVSLDQEAGAEAGVQAESA